MARLEARCPIAGGGVRDGKSHASAGEARLCGYLRRAWRRACRGRPAEPGRNDADVINGNFEDWQPETGEGFELVYAVTAWNWVDPKVRYEKAWQLLRPEGHLAFWNAAHVFPDGGAPFFRDIQPRHTTKYGEGRPVADNEWPRPGELLEQSAEIEESGLFETVEIRHFDWERVYRAEAYIRLLETFSGHILMEPWKRDKLFGEIRARLNRRPDPSVRRHWGAVLHIARRKNEQARASPRSTIACAVLAMPVWALRVIAREGIARLSNDRRAIPSAAFNGNIMTCPMINNGFCTITVLRRPLDANGVQRTVEQHVPSADPDWRSAGRAEDLLPVSKLCRASVNAYRLVFFHVLQVRFIVKGERYRAIRPQVVDREGGACPGPPMRAYEDPFDDAFRRTDVYDSAALWPDRIRYKQIHPLLMR